MSETKKMSKERTKMWRRQAEYIGDNWYYCSGHLWVDCKEYHFRITDNAMPMNECNDFKKMCIEYCLKRAEEEGKC